VSVLFRNSQKAVSLLASNITALGDFVLQREDASDKEVSVLFTDDAGISELNAKHLGRNGPTDVLAFPMSAPGDDTLHPEILGDVAVSTERAVSYAEEHGLKVGAELSLYLIHGLLHLLGYDDLNNDQATTMRRRESELLGEARKLGLIIETEHVAGDGRALAMPNVTKTGRRRRPHSKKKES
jgi:probable rRNA maturation factor